MSDAVAARCPQTNSPLLLRCTPAQHGRHVALTDRLPCCCCLPAAVPTSWLLSSRRRPSVRRRAPLMACPSSPLVGEGPQATCTYKSPPIRRSNRPFGTMTSWPPDHEQAIIHTGVVLSRRRVREARLCATGVVVHIRGTPSSPCETPSVSFLLPASSQTQTGECRRILSDSGSELQRLQNSTVQVQEKERDEIQPHQMFRRTSRRRLERRGRTYGGADFPARGRRKLRLEVYELRRHIR